MSEVKQMESVLLMVVSFMIKSCEDQREARKGQGAMPLAGFGAAPQAGFRAATLTFPISRSDQRKRQSGSEANPDGELSHSPAPLENNMNRHG